MNKRIITAFIGSIIAAMLLLTIAFLKISNLQKLENVKNELNADNAFVMNYLAKNPEDEESVLESVDSSIRITLIDSEGKVLFDSSGLTEFENHLNRKEIQEALISGTGSDVRVSKSVGEQMVYFATRLPDGRFIRSSMGIDSLALGPQFLSYMVIALILVLIVSYLVALRISNYLLEPITEMSYATERVASGEYSRRVLIRKEPEFNKLGTNFNNMAEKLENTFLDNEEKQNRLEAILKSMNSGVFAFDNHNKIIIINPFCKVLFGIQGDIIGKNVYDIKELRDIMFTVESEEEAIEVRIEKPMVKDIRVKSAEIHGDRVAKVGTVVVLEDITDLKKLEKMRSQFVANVSHELKTPLTSIKGFSETLKYVEDEETRIKFLDIINEESERLTRLINDILTLSTIEQTKSAKIEFLDISSETDKIYHMLAPKAESKNIKFSLTSSGNLHTYGDKDNFKQMIINLVDNAIKYTKDGGEVKIVLDKIEDKLRIVVQDSGIGIPKKHLDRIYERFYRVDKSRDRVMGGTGLGLAIVKHIVLSFNGTIDLESEPGKGTKFTILIPEIIEVDEENM
ncbi:MAG: ATP-binding protein [Clostridiaceae bacterium]